MAHLSYYYGFVSPIVSTCNVNQFCGHWLLSDALHFAISMSLKFKEGNEGLPSFDSLMEENSSVAIELALLVSKIKN
jgi:hypothetical protein